MTTIEVGPAPDPLYLDAGLAAGDVDRLTDAHITGWDAFRFAAAGVHTAEDMIWLTAVGVTADRALAAHRDGADGTDAILARHLHAHTPVG